MANDISEFGGGVAADQEAIRRANDRLNEDADFGQEADDGVGLEDFVYFPESNVNSFDPFVTFSAFRPAYDFAGIINRTPQRGVSLYLPMGYTVSDSINYASTELGIGGEIAQRFVGNNSGEVDNDLMTLAMRGLRRVTGSAADAVTPGTDIQSLITRATGVAINQKAYAVFTGASMRQFQFAFRLVASNYQESRSITKIIKFFRYHAYNEYSDNGLESIIPDSFRVVITQGGRSSAPHRSFIQLPEVACTNVSVSYNRSSISYFQGYNDPVEVDLSLSFQELQPIDRKLVLEGV